MRAERGRGALCHMWRIAGCLDATGGRTPDAAKVPGHAREDAPYMSRRHRAAGRAMEDHIKVAAKDNRAALSP